LLSRSLSNWDYASSRMYLSPFSWIDPGPATSDFDDARPPAYVRDQLLAFRKWGMGGEFANYVYSENLETFDYSPYVAAMQEASSPAAVDSEAPTLQVSPVTDSRITGTAHDNLAVWSVRWEDDGGAWGMARTWAGLVVDPTLGATWQTRWWIPVRALSPDAKRVRVTVRDIKDHRSSRWIRFKGPM
jgi:hypothetical protein